MAVFAIRIVKEIAYQGRVQEFGNTYHYSTQLLEPFPDQQIAEFLIAQEREHTANTVRFIRWESWGPTDGPAFENVMRERVPVNLLGLGNPSPGMYREACALIVWPLPRSPRTNRRRWLRKFLRMPSPGRLSLSTGESQGSDPLAAGARTALLSFADEVRSPPPLGLEDSLCTESGVEPNAASIVRPYLFTRDIGR